MQTGRIDRMNREEIRAALERIEDLPVEVEDCRIKIGEDRAGEPAIRVWVNLSVTDVTKEDRESMRKRVRETVWGVAERPGGAFACVRILKREEEPTGELRDRPHRAGGIPGEARTAATK